MGCKNIIQGHTAILINKYLSANNTLERMSSSVN